MAQVARSLSRALSSNGSSASRLRDSTLGPAVRGAGNAMVRLFVNGKSNAPQAQLVPKRSPPSLRPAQLALTTSAKQTIHPPAKPVGR